MRAELLDPVMLRTFVTVAEHGSFTAAADLGGYTQSAVSRQMAALEGACGVELFARGARGVRLTPAGQYLLPYATALLDRFADTRRALDALRELDAGVLRVAAFPTANGTLIPRALARFNAEHPGITLTLREETTERLLPMLEAGDTDLAVVSTHKTTDVATADTELIHLLDEPLLVAMSSGHALAARRRVALAELADERWIVADTPQAVAALHATCARAGFTPDTPLRAAAWNAKHGLVAAGLGVTLVPGLAAGQFHGDVVVRPIAPDPPQRAVYAAARRHVRGSPAVAAFVSDLRTAAGDLRTSAPAGDPGDLAGT